MPPQFRLTAQCLRLRAGKKQPTSVVPRRILLIGPIRPIGPMRCGTPRVFGATRRVGARALCTGGPQAVRRGLDLMGTAPLGHHVDVALVILLTKERLAADGFSAG